MPTQRMRNGSAKPKRKIVECRYKEGETLCPYR